VSPLHLQDDLQKWPTHLMPKNGIHHPCFGEGVPGNVAASIEARPGLRWRLWRRYKQDILPMGVSSESVLQLRPVTFSYKQDA